MPREELELLLEELRRELDAESQLDDATRQELNRLQESISERLKQDGDGGGESMTDALSDSINRFEHSHPSLTMTLGRIADILNKLGI